MTDLARRRSAEVATGSWLFVPLGSTEQHGPHLPLATDTLIATALASAMAERVIETGAPATVAPPLPYGAAGEHQSFPGTLSIGHDALQTVLVELARSARHHHDAVVFVNGHGGNHPTVVEVADQLTAEGHRVAMAGPSDPAGDAHAGLTETSLMLHLHPDLVDMQRAEPGNREPLSAILPAMRDGGIEVVSPNGVLGDPVGATAEHGARLFREMIERAASSIVEQLAR